MRALPTVLALAYAALSTLTGLGTAWVGLYDRSDAMAVVGVACFAVGLISAGALLGGSRVGDAAFVVHAVLLAAGAVLSAPGSSDVVTLAYMLTGGVGFALRQVSASSGARGTRAGRYA